MFNIDLSNIVKAVHEMAAALREVAKEIRLSREEFIKYKGNRNENQDRK